MQYFTMLIYHYTNLATMQLNAWS